MLYAYLLYPPCIRQHPWAWKEARLLFRIFGTNSRASTPLESGKLPTFKCCLYSMCDIGKYLGIEQSSTQPYEGTSARYQTSASLRVVEQATPPFPRFR